MTARCPRPWRFRVLKTTTAIRRGGVVLYPTEGVWGVGCDPRNPKALERLLKLKRRPASKGLILLAHAQSPLAPWVGRPTLPTPPQDGRATTWVIPTRLGVSPLLRGKHRSLAVRITEHAPARELAAASGGVITSTSANLSGFPTPRTRWAVQRLWRGRVDGFLGAPLGGQNRPSRIFDTVSKRWVRD